jgi:carboxypeptidase PM20D1
MTAQLERFCAALRIDTIWPDSALPGSPEFERAEAALLGFQALLQSSFPAFHAVTERTVLGPYGVLYRWPGSSDAAAAEKPVLLLAHYDVVAVEREKWTVEPFGAQVKDGFIWSRGTLDTKNTLIDALEAAEALATQGFRPKRDLWFSFGGDEERSGALGAKRAAAWFAERGISFAWTLDEGSVVADGLLSGIKKPLGLVGVEEKGILNIELTVRQKPGHASMPPRVQSVAILGRALDRLSRRHFPFQLTSTVEAFFRNLAPHASGIRALAMANPRVFSALLFASAASSPQTAALLRTSVAMTKLQGSLADNVMPSEVKAVLNLRLLPGWTIEKSVDFVRRAIADPRVEVTASTVSAGNNPVLAGAKNTEGRGPGWAEITGAIHASFPEAAVMPFLVTVTTDSRHYASLCDAVYRFAPLKLNSEELARIHGHDERISIENFTAGIEFYRTLIASL